ARGFARGAQTSRRSGRRHRDDRDGNPRRGRAYQSAHGQGRRVDRRARPYAGTLFHPRDGPLGRGTAVSSLRALCLSARRPPALRGASSFAARAARTARTIARAGGRDAHRRGDRRCGAARRQPRRGSRTRARSAQTETVNVDSSRIKRVTGLPMSKAKKIVYQGEPGANSHLACRNAYPGYEPVPQPTFEDAFAAVRSGAADLAMIPIENSVAGRVADIHHLMPTSRLNIIGEYFLPVRHQLLAPKGATLKTIKSVESHVQ